ncbi:MAG TPA: hypothetical protein VIP70_00495 [Nitrososphaeraceae archaeon]
MTKMTISLLLGIFFLSSIVPYLAPAAIGQHHGASPPSTIIGNRKISLDFETQPNPIKANQDITMNIGFIDENAKKNVNHVTFRMGISKDGNRLLSEFFHSHEGKVNISFKDNNKTSSSSSYTVGANSDILTNAWIADPGSPIIVRGGQIFSQPGTYKTIIEVTTLDNDKTDLPQPVKFEFELPVS